MKKQSIEKFADRIDIQFKNPDLLQQVFIHRSYLNENKSLKLAHNERLEFLGDAVLELIVTEYLYNNFPNPEGDLTSWRSALVRGEKLSAIAQKLGVEETMLLSRGEQKSNGKSRQIILANAFEALVGAIYLDRGYETTKNFLEKHLIADLPKILEECLYRDAKSHFQELIQAAKSITPIYRVLEESGPDHNKHFIIGVYIDEKLMGRGEGNSKQEAEQNAAQKALVKIQNSKP